MAALFLSGVSAGVILSTTTIPYTLLLLNGVVAGMEYSLPSPYSYLGIYFTIASIGIYYIGKDNLYPEVIKEEEVEEEMDEEEETETEETETEEAEEAETDEEEEKEEEKKTVLPASSEISPEHTEDESIYADMPPLVEVSPTNFISVFQLHLQEKAEEKVEEKTKLA